MDTVEGGSSVWGSSGTDVFTAGGSRILHYDGTSWSPQRDKSDMCEDCYFRDMWGSSGNDIFAVGYSDYGTIYHYDGTSWSQMDTGVCENCYIAAIWGSSGTDVFAAGSAGNDAIILHYDGTSWSIMYRNSCEDYCHFNSVWGSSGNDVFAVGYRHSEGMIYHYDGKSWSPMNIEADMVKFKILSGVWGSSGTDVFAVSWLDEEYSEGSILHYDGVSWTPMDTGIIHDLFCIWGSSKQDVYAGGRGGTILHYDGTAWSHMESRSESMIRGIWGSSENDVFAVGEDGTILHCGEATSIDISHFRAFPSDGRVTVRWTTRSEIGTKGFNLYRLQSASRQRGDSEYLKINPTLISAKGSPTRRAFYQFVDDDVENRKTCYYKLEEIDNHGKSTFHGPVSATPRWLYKER
jgi:hypothetical protein